MSANNVVWCMSYENQFHVFYSGCMDNTPTKPDYKDKHYGYFVNRKNALIYAHDVVECIGMESLKDGYAGVEYGVQEIKGVDNKTVKEMLEEIIQFQKQIIHFIVDDTEPNRFKALGTRQGKAFDLLEICDKMLKDVKS